MKPNSGVLMAPERGQDQNKGMLSKDLKEECGKNSRTIYVIKTRSEAVDRQRWLLL